MSVLHAYLFGFIGEPGLLIIAAIVLLLFGNRLPSLMRNLGQGVTEFKKGVAGISDDDEDDRPKRRNRGNIDDRRRDDDDDAFESRDRRKDGESDDDQKKNRDNRRAEERV